MGMRLTPRSQQLANLGSTQVQTAQAQQQVGIAEDASARRLQEAARAATSGGTAQQLQQAGAAMAGAQAQAQTQAMAQGMETQGQLQQAALQQRGAEIQQITADRKRQLEQQRRLLQRKLFNMDRRLGEQLFVKQLKFQKDELGRTIFNEQKLADYKLLTAKSQQEFMRFEQMQRQASQRKLQFLKAADQQIKQKLEQEMLKAEQDRDQEAILALTKWENKIKLDTLNEIAEAKNRAARNQAFGGMLGAGIGLAIGIGATIATGGTAAPLIAPLTTGGSKIGSGAGSLF